jgi:hypothetical protein
MSDHDQDVNNIRTCREKTHGIVRTIVTCHLSLIVYNDRTTLFYDMLVVWLLHRPFLRPSQNVVL